MDAVLDYSKVPFMIQSYSKDQSYFKATGTPSDPKDNMQAWGCTSEAATSSTSEEVSGLNMNYDRKSTLDGEIYPLKAFVPGKYVLWGSI